MKISIIGIVLLLFSLGVSANEHEHRGHGHHHSGGNWWIAPAIIGGAAIVGGALYQPRHPPQVYQPPMPPYGYHFEIILDYNCNCYRSVLVPN